ncbi:hypothetical protein Tco_1194080 [Tanacetum coccineum]
MPAFEYGTAFCQLRVIHYYVAFDNACVLISCVLIYACKNPSIWAMILSYINGMLKFTHPLHCPALVLITSIQPLSACTSSYDITVAESMANAEQAPAMASPTRTDEQIVATPIDLHNNTSIYRFQQFWDTIRFDRKAGSFKCQLDEQWFNLNQDTLRDALQITPVDNNRAFSSPPTPDTFKPSSILPTGKLLDLESARDPCYKSFGVLSTGLTSTMLKGCGKNLLNPSTPSQKTKGSWHNIL